MVKILANGEIVQDNDPRLKKSQPGGDGGGGGGAASDARRRWSGQVRGVHSPPPAPEGAPRPASAPPASQAAGAGGGAGTGGEAGGNPLDQIAILLGIHGKTLAIPAIEPLNFSSTDIPLIYMLLLGLMVFSFGVASIVFALAAYAYYKYTQNNQR
jgi:hypothetical protein